MSRQNVSRRRMYAISAKGFGLISETLAYTRRGAIERWLNDLPANSFGHDWESAKRAGYRTVHAVVETTGRFGTYRSTKKVRK